MPAPDPQTLLAVCGVLDETLREIVRERLPGLMDRHAAAPVRLLITTETQQIEDERQRPSSFFLPGDGGEASHFTWKGSGPLEQLMRRLRLEFLRHLNERDSRLEIYFELALAPEPEPLGRAAIDAPMPGAPGPPEPAVETARTAAVIPIEETTDPHIEPPPPTQVEPAAIKPPPVAETPSAVPRRPLPAPPHREPVRGRSSTPLPGNFYQGFFGFDRMPFNNTPDPHFFFPTEKHREALARLKYVISERKGFVMISGEIGSGKSTLCRTLLSQLPGEVKTALITHTHIDAQHLVRAIAEDFDLPVTGLNNYEVLQVLNRYLVAQMAAGATVVILIDEAQHLTTAALEEIRMISNLETPTEKLVQLVLLGQPELRDKIRLPEMLQLRQRIAVQFHLNPLDRREAIEYIRHRLRVAAPVEPVDFRTSAMHLAFNYSGGVPRLLNILCDNALLTAFTRQTRTITSGMIRDAAADLQLEQVEGSIGDLFRFW